MRAHGTLYWPDGGDRDGFATGFAATAGEGRAFAVVVDFGLEADAAVAEARGSADVAAGFGLATGAAVVGADATGLAAAGGGALTDASAGLAAGAAVVRAGVLVRFPGGGDGLAV